MAPFWHPFGDVMGLFWLGFSGYARLELKGIVPASFRWFGIVVGATLAHLFLKSHLLEKHILLGGRLAPSVNPFSSLSYPFHPSSPSVSSVCLLAGACERSEAERGHCVVEAAPHNCAFRFWLLRFLLIWGWFGDPVSSFLGPDGLHSMFISGLFPAHFLYRFLNGIADSWSF